MSNNLTWFSYNDVGAPISNNTPGSLIACLRACLVDGFNEKSVTSIDVLDGIATVHCDGHGYSNEYKKYVNITGAPEHLLNGRKQPITVTTNSFTFSTTTPSGTYTGSITAKRAPAIGWEMPFIGDSDRIAIFRRTTPGVGIAQLRVDDTGVASARMLMVRNVIDINTYSNPAPTHDYNHWLRAAYNVNTPISTPIKWMIFADERNVFWFVQSHYSNTDSTDNRYIYYQFGDGYSFTAKKSTTLQCQANYQSGNSYPNSNPNSKLQNALNLVTSNDSAADSLSSTIYENASHTTYGTKPRIFGWSATQSTDLMRDILAPNFILIDSSSTQPRMVIPYLRMTNNYFGNRNNNNLIEILEGSNNHKLVKIPLAIGSINYFEYFMDLDEEYVDYSTI